MTVYRSRNSESCSFGLYSCELILVARYNADQSSAICLQRCRPSKSWGATWRSTGNVASVLADGRRMGGACQGDPLTEQGYDIIGQKLLKQLPVFGPIDADIDSRLRLTSEKSCSHKT